MRNFKTQVLSFIATFAVLWGFLESALALGVWQISQNPTERILYYLLFLSVSVNVTSLVHFLNKGSDAAASLPKAGADSSLPLSKDKYEIVRESISDNDFRVLLRLESQHNELSGQIFSAVFPNAKIKDKFDYFTRRLIDLTLLGLICPIGGSEIAITKEGLSFVNLARQDNDPKYQHILHPRS